MTVSGRFLSYTDQRTSPSDLSQLPTYQVSALYAPYETAAAQDATASGDTLASIDSLIAELAVGDSSTSGGTLTASLSLISGIAAAAAAAASGQAFTASDSISVGTVSAQGATGGQTLSFGESALAGLTSGDATAQGVALSASAPIFEGTTSGAADINGAVLEVTSLFIAGVAAGTESIEFVIGGAPPPKRIGAQANGRLLSMYAQLRAGSARGDAVAGDPFPLRVKASLNPNIATGVNDLPEEDLIAMFVLAEAA